MADTRRRSQVCPSCNGDGFQTLTCQLCNGKGCKSGAACRAGQVNVTCNRCLGTGKDSR